MNGSFLRHVSLSAALAAVLTTAVVTPALAETIDKFESKDGYGWGKVVWKPSQDATGPYRKWRFELTLHSDPKQGHGQTGVQWKVVYNNLPDTDWRFFVGPSYSRVHRGPVVMSVTSIPAPEGVRFRVCRKNSDDKLECGRETKLYKH
ncbi:hypothetical protein [Allokutzneria oryzae]|uniref:Uncharacterized protein n=1 Tax=Allokutzneria oryzae TaxID=1378989 RepID=A0ABV6A8F9_9PSEU